MQKKALGRGLEALFERPAPEDAAALPRGRLLELETRLLIPNKYQPRKVFKEGELESLAVSIRRRGVLQPVLVRRGPGGQYELIAGERRWRAAIRAGLEKIPALVQEASDEDSMELALIENLQREDLNPIESAKAYRRLMEEFRLTQEDVAGRVGKERSSIANAVRLLGLPGEVQDDIQADRISAGHAKVLLSVTGPQGQIRLARQIVRKGLSVRAAEAAARRISGKHSTESARTAAKAPLPVGEAQERLMRYLGTRVRIMAEIKGGRISIQYHDTNDLGRLLDLILK